ncbi:hypothetical protein PFDG_03818 [Plasmodium falciparum Dd2]|uniref:Uncharacterized protein n=1 Tax=Plasmodium falciparum (isolate Dd2) TaxID=57267 RepID=A0A0L7M7P5_PLAF4|nr:hypothetical protein PFDG_03818 [Plasmodium falciparum Dd2]
MVSANGNANRVRKPLTPHEVDPTTINVRAFSQISSHLNTCETYHSIMKRGHKVLCP